MPRTWYRCLAHGATIFILGVSAINSCTAQQTGRLPPTDPDLRVGFITPPESAKPRVWWHWVSGNISEPGITADLEWMHRVGIGGFQLFDGDLGLQTFVPKPVVWMTP